MNFGQLLGGAGVVGQGWREAEDAQRKNRQLQLQTDEMNRLNQLRQEMLKAPMPEQMQLPQFGMDTLPVRDIEPSSLRRMTPDEIARLQRDPYAEGKLPAPPVAPVNEGLGVRRMTPDEIARLQQDPYAVGSNQPAMTPSEIQRERDRLALLKVPTAALDVIQAPMAGGLNLVTMAGEQVLNFGGRLINAVTGADVAPTDLQGPRFSVAPFYDKYVKAPEEKLDARVQDAQRFKELKDRAEAFKTAPTKPSKTALSYDNKVTPYDAVIQQSAEQYGVDPMVFKRLLGTESSFSPVAVSPRGEKFGLGIAQIASSHGLTREQRLDPNTAIPFAAQLFSKYLQESGGNYEVALQKYKGASKEKGKAAMAGPIATILSGRIPSAQAAEAPASVVAPPLASAAGAPIQTAAAAVPTQAAATGAPSKAQVSEASQFYLANPQAIPLEMQRAMQQRAEIERMAGMYQRAGMGAKFMEARAKLMEVDNGMTYLQGMQGMQEFAIANDPRRMAAVWSQYAGIPVGIQPRSDGKFDILVNGKRTKEGVSANDVTNSARLAFDQTYRQQQASAGAEYNKESFKAQLKMQENQGKELAQMIREIAVERVKGNNAQALEWAKVNYGWDIKPTGAGDGSVIIRAPGAAPYLFNPSGRTIEIDGVKITTNAAYPISGLPSYGGVKQ